LEAESVPGLTYSLWMPEKQGELDRIRIPPPDTWSSSWQDLAEELIPDLLILSPDYPLRMVSGVFSGTNLAKYVLIVLRIARKLLISGYRSPQRGRISPQIALIMRQTGCRVGL